MTELHGRVWFVSSKRLSFLISDNGDYESDSELMATAHAMDWQLRDDLLAATKVCQKALWAHA